MSTFDPSPDQSATARVTSTVSEVLSSAASALRVASRRRGPRLRVRAESADERAEHMGRW